MFRRLALPTVAVAAFALAFVAPAGAAPTWLPHVDVQPLSTDSAPANATSRAVARPDGTVVWVALQNNASLRVESRVRPPGGSFGPPQVLGPVAAPTIAAGVLLATEADGAVVATWYEVSGAVVSVRAAVMEPGATTFGPAQTLASGTTVGVPSGVAIGDGSATVVWTNYDGASTRVQASVRPRGGTFGPPATLSDAGLSASAPSVGAGADGTTIVIWQRVNATDHQVVQAAVRPPGGVFGALPDLYANPVTNASNGHIDTPKVAVSADGRATAMFSSYDGTKHTLYAMSRATTGSFSGLDTVSDPSVDQTGATFSLALDDQNTAVAVWNQNTIEGTTRPSGGSFSDVIQPLSQAGGGGGTPTVAFAPDGTAIVVFAGSSGSFGAMQAVTRPRGGTFSGPTDLDAGSDAAQPRFFYSPPPVAIDDQGNATTIYAVAQDILPGGSTDYRFNYVAATYDAGAPTIGTLSVPSSATVGSAVTLGAAATDRWTTASLTWSFGDGSAGGSGGAVAHSYTAPGTYTVTVTATDAVGNATTRSAPITVTAAPPGGGPIKGSPPPALAALAGKKVSGSWKAGRTSTTLKGLSVGGVPKGATVAVRCSGGSAKGCPFSRKSVKVAKAGTVSLTKYFNFTKKRGKRTVKVVSRLKSGAVVSVTVTAPGLRGRSYRATMRRGKAPTVSTGCLAVGSTTKTTSC